MVSRFALFGAKEVETRVLMNVPPECDLRSPEQVKNFDVKWLPNFNRSLLKIFRFSVIIDPLTKSLLSVGSDSKRGRLTWYKMLMHYVKFDTLSQSGASHRGECDSWTKLSYGRIIGSWYLTSWPEHKLSLEVNERCELKCPKERLPTACCSIACQSHRLCFVPKKTNPEKSAKEYHFTAWCLIRLVSTKLYLEMSWEVMSCMMVNVRSP